MNKQILVLGCSGEVGSRLSKKLLNSGFTVFGISGIRKCTVIHPKHFCRSMDLLNSKINLGLDEIKPITLIHAAWITKSPSFWNSSVNDKWVESSKLIIQDFEKHGGKNLVITSTCAEYDWKTSIPLKETSLLNPLSKYGKSKLELFNWVKSRNISLLWTRTFFQFGLKEQSQRLIPSLIDHLLRGEKYCVETGNDTRDFIYIEDVVGLLELLITNNSCGTFNIGSGIGYKVNYVAKTVANLVGASDLVEFRNNNSIGTSVVSNNEKLLQAVGNYSWTDFETAISKTIFSRKDINF